MSAYRIILASLPSLCQKLSKLVDIWRSSDKNNFAQFFETRCIYLWKLYDPEVGAYMVWVPHNKVALDLKTRHEYLGLRVL